MLPIGHTNWLSSVKFSPDGQRIVTASWDGTAKIWDASTGELLANLEGHTGVVESAVFSPDGKKIVTASDDHTAKIWDASTGKVLVKLEGHTDNVLSAAFSPDGKKIVTSSRDKTAKIWDTSTGKLMANLKSHADQVNSAAFSLNGKKIVTVSDDGTAKIWDGTAGKLLANLSWDSGIEALAAFSPDGKRIVTASTGIIVNLWDSSTGKLLVNLKGNTSSVKSVSFSPDGKKIVTALEDHTAKIWDSWTGKLLANLRGHTAYVESAVFSPDGKKILTSSTDKTAKIWSVVTGKLLATLKGHTDYVNSAIFSPDGKKIATASWDHTTKIWDASTFKLLANLRGRTSAVASAAFSPDGDKIVTASWDSTARIWDPLKGKLLTTLRGHTDQVNSATFSPDGEKVVTASKDKTARIWDALNGRPLECFKNHLLEINSAMFSSDGKTVVTNSWELTALWDASTGNSLTSVGWENSGTSAALSPNGKKIAISSRSKNVKIWDASSNELLLKLEGHTGPVLSAAFSPDGKSIVTASEDSTARIWDASTGRPLASLRGHTDYVRSAVFSPDGTKIVTASDDRTAKIWNVATCKIIANLLGHTNEVSSAAFSPDGKKIVTASYDGECKIWNSETGEILYTFFAIDRSDYLVVDKYDHYDGTEAARKLLYFTCGTEEIGLDQVKDQLWVPNLAERIMKGDSINAPKLSDLNICGLTPSLEKEENSGYHFTITPQRGGLGETALLINGIQVKQFKPSELTKTTTGYELNLDEKELAPYFISGQENPVAVKAYTANNDISSRGAEIMQDETKKKTIAPNLYAVMIGVSDYKGTGLQLKYAAKDAEDMSRAISASAKKLLDTAGGREHVFMYNLTTGKNRYELPEKIAIKNVFGEIGKKATANDILLIFFAGHGVTSGEKKQFYFLTADASQASATDAPDQVGISTKELSEWLQPSDIKAQKRILILDACNSGQAINELVKVGADGQNYLAARNDDKAEQIKAIDKLNEKSGLFILAASASNQSAYEMGRYSQGLLTYSLLKAIKQQPDILEDNKYLNVSRWFNAAEKTVSDMVRETGNRQEPQIVSAGNFNIGVVDQDVRLGIKLADEKPLFTASNLQNNDADIAADNLHLNSLLDNQLNEISARGENNGITYIPGSNSPDAYSLGGRYIVDSGEITVKVNIRQNDVTKYKFEMSWKKNDLKGLAEKLVDEATDWILKKK